MVAQNNVELSWGKSLKSMPIFSLREIEEHRRKVGKSVAKRLTRGRTLKMYRSFISNNILTRYDDDVFFVKADCKESNKDKVNQVNFGLCRKSSNVTFSSCNCTTEENGLCNHILKVMLEMFENNMNGNVMVPEERALQSISLNGVLEPNGASIYNKKPMMNHTILKHGKKRGIQCTLDNPDLDATRDTKRKKSEMRCALENINPIIECQSICEEPLPNAETKSSHFSVSSLLSNQFKTFEPDFRILSNIKSVTTASTQLKAEIPNLPVGFIESDSDLIPSWILDDDEKNILSSFSVTQEQCFNIERSTRQQAESDLWHRIRKNRITASRAHKIFTRKRCFDTLVRNLFRKRSQSLYEFNPFAQRYLQHGVTYEPIARNKYLCVMQEKFNHILNYRDCGVVLQPVLPWLGCTPDGIIVDSTIPDVPILLEIKCPASKWDYTPRQLLATDSFYIGSKNGELFLKKDHYMGYYTQIQMAMGLSKITLCDFIVYTKKCLIIIRVNYDHDYFQELVTKLNNFFRDYVLDHLYGTYMTKI